MPSLQRTIATATLAVTLATSTLTATLAAPVPPNAANQQAILTTIDISVAAINASNERMFAGTFAPQVTITDDLPPFHWTGTDTPHAWYQTFQNAVKQGGLMNPKIVLGTPHEKKIVGDRAYESIPATFNYRVKDEAMHDKGALVFTLVRTAGAWKITSVTWAGL